jgi:hypothetical protein
VNGGKFEHKLFIVQIHGDVRIREKRGWHGSKHDKAGAPVKEEWANSEVVTGKGQLVFSRIPHRKCIITDQPLATFQTPFFKGNENKSAVRPLPGVSVQFELGCKIGAVVDSAIENQAETAYRNPRLTVCVILFVEQSLSPSQSRWPALPYALAIATMETKSLCSRPNNL